MVNKVRRFIKAKFPVSLMPIGMIVQVKTPMVGELKGGWLEIDKREHLISEYKELFLVLYPKSIVAKLRAWLGVGTFKLTDVLKEYNFEGKTNGS